MTKVIFEVLVSDNGKTQRGLSEQTMREGFKTLDVLGRKVHIELREEVAEDAEQAYQKALDNGGAWWRTMKYKSY